MSRNLTQYEFPGMELPEADIEAALDRALSYHLKGRDMRPLKRKPVSKNKSAKRFRNQTRKTKAANGPMRGGYRF